MAGRTRRQAAAPGGNPATFAAALYIRLSKEDGGRENAGTVENQKAVLENYVRERAEFSCFEFYIDNGFTGTRFERPEFSRMMEDIREKKVNCVIVKDLSRFGRNYLEAGDYLEHIFPALGVRFIAVTDQLDTFSPSYAREGLMLPLKNIVNDIYAKDISRKVKSALDVRMEEGRYAGGTAPYGYRKSGKENGKLQVDEAAAAVVRSIFRIRAQGKSYAEIVRMLNAAGISPPGVHRFQTGMIKEANMKHTIWKRHAVENILKDEVYLGNMVRGKTRTALYRGEKRHKVPREDWIIIRGTHEAIISESLFQKVQALRKP